MKKKNSDVDPDPLYGKQSCKNSLKFVRKRDENLNYKKFNIGSYIPVCIIVIKENILVMSARLY